MPELPEVYTITQDLNENVIGYTIRDCHITRGYTALPTNDTFINTVTRQRIERIERIAKNILIHLSNKGIIHFHLAMTGQIRLKEYKEVDNRWLRVLMKIEKESTDKFLSFNDMRMFGKIAVIGERERENLFKKYGPEPIDDSLDAKTFLKKLKSKRTTIKKCSFRSNSCCWVRKYICNRCPLPSKNTSRN